MSEETSNPVGKRWLFILFLMCIPLVLQLRFLHSNGNCKTENTTSVVNIKSLWNSESVQDASSFLFNNKNKTTFVFFVGLEGTGHHLVKELVVHSPTMRRLDTLGLNITHKQLSKSLFSRAHPENGLMNAHCSDEEIDVKSLQDRVVDLLQTMENATRSPMYIPVNCMGANGFYSYPVGWRACLNYPNLDLFYQACMEANVVCKHVLLYRNPYALLYSTTIKRHYNPTILKAIHLYTTMLNVIYSQLETHGENNTLECFGLFEDDSNMWRSLQHLLGWNNDHSTEFMEFVNDVYTPPTLLTFQQQLALVPPELQVYMTSMMRAHDAVVKLCRQQAST